MRVDRQDFGKMAVLFARYGVEPFLETTSLLVAVLDRAGRLLSWNPSFDSLRQTLPDKNLLQDFLLPASKSRFDELLAKTIRGRARTRGNMEFVYDGQDREFASLFVPLPEQHVLFIAEPVSSVNDLEAITAELDKARQSLERKEVELKAVLAQADEVSHTDALTFLPNRKQIMGDLQREVIFSDRYGTPLAISMLDIDHFKKVNDTYGHAAGDEVLRRLASELRDHIRHPDTIGRYGGEEFLVILPGCDEAGARRTMERVRSRIAAEAVVTPGGELGISCSIGVACASLDMGVAPELLAQAQQELLQRADEALYAAKRNGRNRVEVS